MKNKPLKLHEVIALPAVNAYGVHTMCKYYIVSKYKGGVYDLVAESRFTVPYERTILRAKPLENRELTPLTKAV